MKKILVGAIVILGALVAIIVKKRTYVEIQRKLFER